MGGINRVIIVGNLGQDPEIRRTQSGDPIANMSVATSETWRDKSSGERREKTEWHKIVVFGKTAEVVEKYLHKGSKVGVEGQLQTRKWQDKDGNDRWSTEIAVKPFSGHVHLLGDGNSGDGGGRSSNKSNDGGSQSSGGGSQSGGGRYDKDMDDDIPF